MQEQQNIDLVKKLYGAFGKGDIDTIIDHLAGQFIAKRTPLRPVFDGF